MTQLLVDIWTTSARRFVHVNGVTKTVTLT